MTSLITCYYNSWDALMWQKKNLLKSGLDIGLNSGVVKNNRKCTYVGLPAKRIKYAYIQFCKELSLLFKD
jgi:hypothetical protein